MDPNMLVETYGFIVIGITISLVLPIIAQYIPKASARSIGTPITGFRWVAGPYIAVGAASLITAILLIFVYDKSLKDWRGALLAGYVLHSTLQKFPLLYIYNKLR